jgi:hypothetical protein
MKRRDFFGILHTKITNKYEKLLNFSWKKFCVNNKHRRTN